jgi:photosystem II stability/assembly factor-like uncharacterized protein
MPVTYIKNSIYRLVCFACLIFILAKPTAQSVTYAAANTWVWLGISGQANQIVADPINPAVVYAVLDYNKILKTEDGGQTWSNITPQNLIPANADIRKIAMAPSNPDVLYIATFGAGPYRSDDGGKNWQPVYGNTTRGNWDYAIAVSPLDWKEAYLVTSESAGAFSIKTQIWRTVDGGGTWEKEWEAVDDQLSVLIDEIVIAPSAPHILFAKPYGVRNFLLKSVDYGQTWTSLPIPNSGWSGIAVDPTNANTVYLGSSSPAAWKSTDGGVSWTPLTNGLSGIGVGFAIDAANTQIIHAAAYEAGVMESDDAGLSWSPINNGIQGIMVISIAVASRDPLTIFAGVGTAGIWKLIRTDVQDYSVSINNGAVFTNQTAVNLNLTTPASNSSMMISNDGGFAGAVWEPFKTLKPWTIIAYGNYVIPRTVYVKFKTGGVISGVYTDDIILDQTPPVGAVQITDTLTTTSAYTGAAPVTSAIIHPPTTGNSLYLPFAIKVYNPSFRLVGLSLTATDDVSGVESMQISNTADFATAAWQDFTQHINWTVNQNGSTTVYVKYRDRAGNVSQVYTTVASTP